MWVWNEEETQKRNTSQQILIVDYKAIVYALLAILYSIHAIDDIYFLSHRHPTLYLSLYLSLSPFRLLFSFGDSLKSYTRV